MYKMPSLLVALLCVSGSLAWGGRLAGAQEAPASPPAAAPPPQVTLGRRAEFLRLRLKVRPTVVIVESPDDYVRAIARWRLQERFPVLIDDGSDRTREDIARFVRAFEPAKVLRWKPETAEDDRLPEEPGAFRAAIEAASRFAWGADSPEAFAAIWQQTQFTPFGVVVASHADPAWAAALALSAGRGQPILWTDAKAGDISGVTDEASVRGLDALIASGLDEAGWAWRTQGDAIEALTLCLNTPTIVQAEGGRLALTDVLGRVEGGARALWAGVVHGDEAASAYRAMCALFLSPRSAWLFDGFQPDLAPPYAPAQAGAMLEGAGLEVSTNVPPRGGLEHWRARAAWGVPFGFIHVNTSGAREWFDLSPGRAFTSDVPFLSKPAMVHFIHSFSAQAPGDARSIAGRWLENGAYCYYGSVDEPLLGAFVPATSLVGRLRAGAPFAASARQEQSRPWKLNYFGDPLATIGGPAPRHEESLELSSSMDVEQTMRDALKAGDLASGARALALLGRDKDVVRLASASLADAEKPATEALARQALHSAFREQARDVFVGLYALFPPDAAREPQTADMLWQALRDELQTTADERVVNWLRATIRTDGMADDAEALAPAIRRIYGVDAVRSMYSVLMQRATDRIVQERLAKDAAKY